MNLEELKVKAGVVESLLKALANRNRLIILCELLGGERQVAELLDALPLSQSAMSQHLARLRADEIVSTRRESQTIHYSLASEKVRDVIELLYKMYCGPECSRGAMKKPTRTLRSVS